MKTRFSIYIFDNEFILLDKKNNKIFNQTFKSIQEDKLINETLFDKELSNFLHKNHIHIPVFGYNITFIKNKSLNEIIKEKYLELFQDYFRKIEVINTEDILKITKDTSFLNITNTYIDYFFEKKGNIERLRIYKELFNDNLNKTISHLLTNIYKSKKIIVFGNNERIPELVETINHEHKIIAKFSECSKNYVIEEYNKY